MVKSHRRQTIIQWRFLGFCVTLIRASSDSARGSLIRLFPSRVQAIFGAMNPRRFADAPLRPCETRGRRRDNWACAYRVPAGLTFNQIVLLPAPRERLRRLLARLMVVAC
jgi:hypothetical protein